MIPGTDTLIPGHLSNVLVASQRMISLIASEYRYNLNSYEILSQYKPLFPNINISCDQDDRPESMKHVWSSSHFWL